MSEEVSLSDRYVLLLQETVKESKILRTQVSQKERETDAKLERLFEKVDELCKTVEMNSPSNTKRKRKRATQNLAPKQCRVSTLFTVYLFKLCLCFATKIEAIQRKIFR